MIDNIPIPRIYEEVKNVLDPRMQKVLTSKIQFDGPFMEACQEKLREYTGNTPS